MRHCVLVLGVLLGLTRPAFAQHAIAPNPVWYPGYVICGHTDNPNYDPAAATACGDSVPTPTPITISRSSVYVSGWSSVCATGDLPSRVYAQYKDAEGIAHDVPVTVYQRLYRPDVRAALAGACPTTTDWSGYAIYFDDPGSLPLGMYRFSVFQTANGDTLRLTDTFILEIVP